jgi:hypothetical protein
MGRTVKLALASLLALCIFSCSKTDPGPLAGSWKLSGAVPMTIHFRNGESEALGMIEKVSYNIKGNQVIVTSRSGPMEGVSARYTITGPNTAVSEFGSLRRIK